MALKKTTIARLAALAKIDEKTLETAIAAADEQEVAIPEDLQVMTKAEGDTRDRNKYNEGKTAGSEMVLKEIKTKHKIEIDGVDPDKIVEAIGARAVTEAKIAPDKQVEEARKERDQFKQKVLEAQQVADQLKKDKEQLALDNRYRSLLPKNRDEILTDDEYLMSTKSRYAIETRENREVVIDRTTNDIVKDAKTLEPKKPEDVFSGYFTERKWIKAEEKGGGGRGGGSPAPGGGAGKFAKLSEVRKWVEDQGENINGQKGQSMMQAAIKENPDMDLRS